MNRRTFLKSAGTAAAATSLNSLSLASLPSIASTTAKSGLLMLAWDSVGHPHARRMMSPAGGSRLPALQSFLREPGVHLIPLSPTGASLTIPVWTEIFTGLTSRQTGAIGNHAMIGVIDDPNHPDYPGLPLQSLEWAMHYDKEHEQFSRLGWLSSIPYENTMQWAMRQRGFETAWLTSKKGYLGSDLGQSPLARISQNAKLCVTTKPNAMDDPYMMALARGAVNFSARNPKSLVFCHLNPDMFGHEYGGESPEYEHEIERCDETLEWVLANVDREKTHVMVISDHGFDGAGYRHLNAPWSWCATDIPLDSRWLRGGASTVDIYPTVLSWFGVDVRGETDLPMLWGKTLL